MPVHYMDVEQVLATKNLRLPALNVLVPDGDPYEALLIQPTGAVRAEPDFVGHANGSQAVARFNAFLQLASDTNVDLVLTPEYSCPWDSLTRSLTRGQFPAPGKIWVISLESISPQSLRATIERFPNYEWVHHGIPEGAGRFLDVIAQLVKAEHYQGGVRDAIVLQFKTRPMAGTTFERENLILGNTIYYWRNQVDHVRLMTLICSEALGFDQAAAQQCGMDRHPFLVLHPQMNCAPRHTDISAYRALIFAQQYGAEVEVIALNWARGFTLLGQSSSYGASAIYTKAPQFHVSDERIEENHKKGLFYSFWHCHRTHLCVLSFDEQIFRLRNDKVRQNVLAVEAARNGPQMLALYRWDVPSSDWIASDPIDGGYVQLCESFMEPACNYFIAPPTTSVDRERLLALSAGKIRRIADWHLIRNLDSFNAESDERTKRLTFTHEASAESQDFRTQHLAAAIKLQTTILPDPANFPTTIQDLRANWSVQIPRSEHDFRFNLLSNDGQAQGATVMFLGARPPGDAERLKDDLIRTWGKVETQRLVIWYEHQGGIRNSHSPVPTFTDDSEPPATVSSGEKS